MEIKHGTSRIVYVDEKTAYKTPPYSFVKDLPRTLRRILRERSSNRLRACIAETCYDTRIFGKGVFANLVEAFMGVVAKDVVVPTRLSLAGLVNIQEKAEPSTLPKSDLRRILNTYFDEELLEEIHGFNNPSNYGVHDGKLKLIDCGSLSLARIVLKKRRELRNALLDLGLMNECPEI
jgi:hypothetical protein